MPQSEKRTSLVVFVNSEREEAINLTYEKVAVKTLADSVCFQHATLLLSSSPTRRKFK